MYTLLLNIYSLPKAEKESKVNVYLGYLGWSRFGRSNH